MDDFTLARVLHILGVVLWIGGVAMVATVLLPILLRMESASERIEYFDRFRCRFAAQARYTTLLVGLSGFYMVHVMDAWYRFTQWQYWWMHAMVFVWAIFTLMLFVMEPLARYRKLRVNATQHAPKINFVKVQRMHWILLCLSLITVAGAVAGSHGWLLFGEWS